MGKVTVLPGGHPNIIWTLMANLRERNILSGCLSGNFRQHHLHSSKSVKHYGALGIGAIYSCQMLRGYVAVGGFNQFRLINLAKKEIVAAQYSRLSLERIYSLHFLKIRQNNQKHEQKTLIALSGDGSDEVHCFDVSHLVKSNY